MAVDREQRIHAATPRRRQQARQEGHVPLSRDLVTSLVMLAVVTTLMLLGESMGDRLLRMAGEQLAGSGGGHVDPAFSVESLTHTWNRQLALVARVILPVLGLGLMVVIAAHVSQTGFLFHPQRVMPRVENIAPQRGLARIFSTGNLGQWMMIMMRLTMVVAVAAHSTWMAREQLAELALLPPPEMASQMFHFLLQTAARICFGLLVLGMGDYFWQRWRWQQQLRMTSQELREEQRLQGRGR